MIFLPLIYFLNIYLTSTITSQHFRKHEKNSVERLSKRFTTIKSALFRFYMMLLFSTSCVWRKKNNFKVENKQKEFFHLSFAVWVDRDWILFRFLKIFFKFNRKLKKLFENCSLVKWLLKGFSFCSEIELRFKVQKFFFTLNHIFWFLAWKLYHRSMRNSHSRKWKSFSFCWEIYWFHCTRFFTFNLHQLQ